MGDECFKPDKYSEFMYILDYIEESEFWGETARDQLLCLWTAYCLHWHIDCDTDEYDRGIQEIYQALHGNECCNHNSNINMVYLTCADVTDASDFDIFDMCMCKYLV